MENQKIHCNVNSCKYNDAQEEECNLDEITIQPCSNCHSGNPEDESMCGNYKEYKMKF